MRKDKEPDSFHDPEQNQLWQNLFALSVDKHYKGSTAKVYYVDPATHHRKSFKIPNDKALAMISLTANNEPPVTPQYQSMNLVTREGNNFYKTYAVPGRNPINPNFEYAGRMLGKALFNSTACSAATGLIVLSNVRVTNGNKKVQKLTRPVQVSHAVEGNLLTQGLENDDWENLNIPHFQQLALLEIFKGHYDGKGDNFIVKTTKEGQQEIITIDGDKIFGKDIVKTGLGHFVELRSTLFTLKEGMNSPITEEVREALCKKTPKEIIHEWLSDLENLNQNNVNLFKNSGLSADYRNDLNAKCNIPQGVIEAMYDNIDTAQRYLNNSPEASVQQVFEAIYPAAALYYKTLNDQSTNANHASKTIFEERQFNIEDVVEQSQLDECIEHQGKMQSYHQLLATKTNAVQAVEDPDFPTISLNEAHEVLDHLAKRNANLSNSLEDINIHMSKKPTKTLLSSAIKTRERKSWQTVTQTLLQSDDKKQMLDTIEEEITQFGKGVYSEKLQVLHEQLNDIRVPQDSAKHDTIIKQGFELAGGDFDNLQESTNDHSSFTPNV